MTKPILLYTNKILQTTCKPVMDFNDPELESLVQEMIQVMIEHNGVGLAANQLGVDKQIAILHVENRSKIMVVINPIILNYTKEKDKQMEGCLSCPGISVKMKRWKGVEVECQDLLGEKHQYRFTDYDCRIFLHEWDHLKGKTIGSTVPNYLPVL